MTDQQIDLAAQNAVLTSIQTAASKTQGTKRKVVELEFSDSSSSDEE